MADFKRIVIHWTAGAYTPNSTDLSHYHFLIDKNGKVYSGKYKPEDNINCGDGKYAQHTGGGNTGAIGIAMCGMYNFKSSTSVGPYPITKVQCEAMFKKVAELCKKYNLNVNSDTVLTHYEFGLKNPKTTSAGKIDIVYLPCYPDVKKENIGVFIRSKVNWYRSKM